ncbi:MAG: methyltransferase domain-containing protein, partial [Planctomycetota bacterium]
MNSDDRDIWLKRPAPQVEIDLSAFDGERFLTGIGGEIEVEHVHRYLFAATLCARKDVLDIACGEGYGSAMLAGVARSVVGVDIDGPTIEQARAAYHTSGVEFEQGDCASIPYKKDSFDVVVSFETIEHIEDHAGFLREIRRVLRPGGILVCSTPDTDVYRHPGGPNPFHAMELDRGEYERLLAKRFSNVRILGQQLISGSVIARPDAGRTELVSTDDGQTFRRGSADAMATYLIAVCSDARLPSIPSNVLNDARYTIGRHTDLAADLSETRLVAEEIERERARARADADASQARSLERQAGLESAERRAERFEQSLAAANDELARMGEQAGRLTAERDAAAH